ncbi:MAG: hypothetical protein JXB32_15755 [Deltaproteobacteria bacterium]|nr:hypothetical protein [Deltaproteobacteria bacterium]
MRIVMLPGNASWRTAARDALSARGLEAVAVDTANEALQAAREGAGALVVDAGSANLGEVSGLLRGSEGVENLPLLVVVRDPLREPLDRSFRLGIDDYLVESAIHQLCDRAVALEKGDPWTGVRASAGRIVLADADRARRQLVARILRHWGFDLSFAMDFDELAEQLRRDPVPRVALVAHDLPPDGASTALPKLRSARPGVEIPWVLLTDPDRLPQAQDIARAYGSASVFDRGGSPENIIFLVNDLLQARAADARRSARLLHGGPVSFWTDGSPEMFWAYSYNINRTGLYVRTLVPPPLGTLLHVWFRPPFGEGLAAADAQVMWRKEYGSKAGPLHPPGVGVQFVRVPVADAAAATAGYEALLEEQEGSGAESGGVPPERPRTTRLRVK